MEFAEVFKSLLALGPGGLVAGVFAYLWKGERDERKEKDGLLYTITKESVTAEKDMTQALELLAGKIGK